MTDVTGVSATGDGGDRPCRAFGHEPGWGLASAAAFLLERWLPAGADGGGPGWRVALSFGRAPRPKRDEREPVPTEAEVAEYGGYPEVFAEAGPAGRRFPVGVGAPAAGAGPARPEAAGSVARLILETVDPEGAGTEERVRLLAFVLARALTERCHDPLRVAVAAEPGGAAVSGELHVLFRRPGGATVRLAVAPAAGPDPVCADRRCAASADEHRRRSASIRMACATTVLSEFLYLNNNNTITFDVAVEPHRLDLPARGGDGADAVFRTWLRERWSDLAPLTGDDEWEDDEEVPDDGHERLVRLDGDEPIALLGDLERDLAASGCEPGLSGEEEVQGISAERFAGQMITWLSRDLFDTLLAEVTGSRGTAPLLGYVLNLPLSWERFETMYHESGLLLLVGPDRVGRLVVDACV